MVKAIPIIYAKENLICVVYFRLLLYVNVYSNIKDRSKINYVFNKFAYIYTIGLKRVQMVQFKPVYLCGKLI